MQRIATIPSSILTLNAPTILPLVGKEYMCFQKDGKTSQAARCINSSIITKVIDYVISIDKFGQQFVMLKFMLQLPRLKYHVQTIGIDQSLSNNSIYEHKCLENKQKIIQTIW